MEKIEQVEKLQALVILDTYSNRYKPLSIDKAECLLTIMGRPLIDYTLEFLMRNKVEEVVLFCKTPEHHRQIQEYLNKSKWKKQADIHLYYNTDCQSVGDAIREIDRLFQTKRTNFLLLTSPGIIANNIKLEPHLKAHKERSERDKHILMTVMCIDNRNDVHLDNYALTSKSDTVLISNANNCIVHYEEASSKKHVQIPLNVMETLTSMDSRPSGTVFIPKPASTLKFQSSLLETKIYICNSYVPHMFTDNFDAQNMSDFIRNIITDDISGYTIHVDKFARTFGSYLAVVDSLNAYYFAAMKLLQLINAFKMNPFAGDQINYLNLSLNVFYDQSSVQMARDVNLKRNLFIDKASRIGAATELLNCYIGKNCKIGSNVRLENSIVLDGTTIGDNCSVNACIIAGDVVLGDGCRLSENSIFSFGCVVKSGTVFDKPGLYYVACDDDGMSDDDDDEASLEESAVNGGELKPNFVRYVESRDSNYGEDEISEFSERDDLSDYSNESGEGKKSERECAADMRQFYVWKIKKSRDVSEDFFAEEDEDSNFSESEDTETEDEDEEECVVDDESSGEEEEDSKPSKATGLHVQSTEDELEFLKEVIAVLTDGIKKNLQVDDMVTEINSAKNANFLNIKDVYFYLAKALVEFPVKSKSTLSANADKETYFQLAKMCLEKFKGVVKTYYFEAASAKSQLLDAVQEFFASNAENKTLLSTYPKLLHFLCQDYDMDEESNSLLEDEDILEWFGQKKKSVKGDAQKKALSEIEKFIEWLHEDDEDDDSDDE